MQAATDRLEMRLPPEDKGLLTRSALLEGVKLSQFVLGPALKRARQVIADVERATTSPEGYRNLLEVLASPPQPTKGLIEAMRDYEPADVMDDQIKRLSRQLSTQGLLVAESMDGSICDGLDER